MLAAFRHLTILLCALCVLILPMEIGCDANPLEASSARTLQPSDDDNSADELRDTMPLTLTDGSDADASEWATDEGDTDNQGDRDGDLDSLPEADAEEELLLTDIRNTVETIKFSVSSTGSTSGAMVEGESPLRVTCTAFREDGGDLPEGTYAWYFDGVEEAGPVNSHANRTHVFHTVGAHTVALMLTLTGATAPMNCSSSETGRKTVAVRVIEEEENATSNGSLEDNGTSSGSTGGGGGSAGVGGSGGSGSAGSTGCTRDSDCNDNNACTDDTCGADGVCVYTADDTNTCDNGLYCDGTESCSGGTCVSSGDPCGGSACNESTDQCVAGPTISGTISLVSTVGARPKIGQHDLLFDGSGSFSSSDYTVTTDVDGHFSQSVPTGWTGTVKASDATRVFLMTPADEWVFGTGGGANAAPVTANTTLNFTAWTAPIGIPGPTFGIKETHYMYANATYDFGSGPVPYPDAGNGPYTHYVDNTHPSATDSSNTYGTPAKPRKTIPGTLAAGSVAEVHGGPYTYGSDKITIVGNGTADKPVFVRGVGSSSRPTFQKKILPNGTYMLLEYLYLQGVGFDIRPTGSNVLQHVAARYCELAGTGNATDPGACGIASYDAGNRIANLTLFNNHIHNFGDSEAAAENDRHGINVSHNTEAVWILDNHIHHNGGDSVQLAHGSNFSTHHAYIGRNLMHDDRENAVDVKEANDVVVSQNVMYGYEDTSSSQGEVAVVHYDPQRIWFLANVIHSGAIGIISSGCDDFYVIGNTIYSMREVPTESHAANSAYRTGVGIRAYNSGDAYVYNNTIYDTEVGIACQLNASSTMNVVNNVISNVVESNTRGLSGYHMIMNGNSTGLGNSDVHHDLLYQPNANPSVCWAGTTYNFVQFVYGAPGIAGKGDGFLSADPKFVDAANANFHLQSTSPAVDSGATHTLSQTIQALYGVPLTSDADGRNTPHSAQYDMGAFEYASN